MFNFNCANRNRSYLFFAQLEFELKYYATIFFLPRRIDEVKQTCVNPNPSPDFLIDLHLLCGNSMILVGVRGAPEQSVLSRCSRRRFVRLVHAFWIRATPSSCGVMTFVDQDLTVLFYAICVWGTWPQTHENYTTATAKTKIHSPLKAGTFMPTHI